MIRQPFGLYTCGDDHIYEWMVGLFQSLRNTNPTLPVVLIPFSNNFQRLPELCARFNVDIERPDSMPLLDQIGESLSFYPGHFANHTWRKFSCWQGRFDTFAFFDADTLVCRDLMEHFRTFADSSLDFAYANVSLDAVYRPGDFMDKMVRERDARLLNTGIYISRRGLFSLDKVANLAAQALTIKQHFHESWEQPFLNYCLDICGLKKASFDELLPDRYHHLWAGVPMQLSLERDRSGRMHVGGDDGKPVATVHWAGLQLSRKMPHFDAYYRFRMLDQGLGAKAAWQLKHRCPGAFRSLAGVRRYFRRLIRR